MIRFVFVAVLVGLALGRKWVDVQDHSYSFQEYLEEFGKTYDDIHEHGRRNSIFMKNLNDVISHNNAGRSWKMEMNDFADWAEEELQGMLGLHKGLFQESHADRPTLDSLPPVDLTQLPDSMDWRTHGIVSSVKDQGRCGSCWAFSTTEALESHIAKKTGILSVLSPQNILDCTVNPRHCGGTGGCGGGIEELGFKMVMEHGISSEWTYPYTSWYGKNEGCKNDSAAGPVPKKVANITNYVKLPTNEYSPLMKAIATEGPVAVSVDARTWFMYKEGVYDGCNQTTPDIDHAVQLVGYGTDAKYGPYWLIRNSWTPRWGEMGYIRLKRNTNDPPCGVDVTPSHGSGCDNGPSNVTVCGTCGVLSGSSYPVV